MRYDIEQVRAGDHIKYLMHRDDKWKWSGNVNVRKNFRIEYVDDSKIWDNIVAEKYKNPWEHYTVVEFETLWDAMEFYMYRLFSTKVYDVKMYCETYVDEKLVLEETMEFCCTFLHDFRKFLDRENTILRDKALDAMEMLQKENESMREFIKKYHAEQSYKEFIENGGK